MKAMIYRKLDETGDYVFGRNQNNYISGAVAVNQAVVTRLRQLIYEWWEDLEDGIPVWQKILGNRNKQEAERIIRERIQKTKYVRSILAFSAEWDNENRKLTIQAVIDTEFGQTELSEVI